MCLCQSAMLLLQDISFGAVGKSLSVRPSDRTLHVQAGHVAALGGAALLLLGLLTAVVNWHMALKAWVAVSELQSHQVAFRC